MNRHFRKRSILIIVVFVMSTALIIAIYRWQQIPDDVIVFVSAREGRPAIYLITPDGSYLRRLTPYECCSAGILQFLNKIFPGMSTRFSDHSPFWSPNGEHIAYTASGNDLSMMNANGTNRQLLSAHGNPIFVAWSPDNSRVFFTSSIDSLFAGDGAKIEHISYGFEENTFLWPVLSPDLQRVAFWTQEEATLPFHVCMAVIQGTGLKCSSIRATSLPTWAPNSQVIAFGCHSDLTYALCIMYINDDQTEEIAIPFEARSALWSPDGKKIVFESVIQQPQRYTDLYVVSADGSGLTRLTNHVEYDVDPSWSPDSSRIVFASTRSGNWDLYIINADGTGLTQLTDNERDDDQPAWRPAR